MASNEIQLQDTALFKYFDEVTLLHKCHVYEQAYFPFRENSCNKCRFVFSEGISGHFALNSGCLASLGTSFMPPLLLIFHMWAFFFICFLFSDFDQLDFTVSPSHPWSSFWTHQLGHVPPKHL